MDDTVVGFASAVDYLHPDKPPELWINEVGVAPAYKGKGIGKAIMNEMLKLGHQLGCKTAWVLTEKLNEPAKRLYSATGSKVTMGDTMKYEFF